jgi:hypothetical protein
MCERAMCGGFDLEFGGFWSVRLSLVTAVMTFWDVWDFT